MCGPHGAGCAGSQGADAAQHERRGTGTAGWARRTGRGGDLAALRAVNGVALAATTKAVLERGSGGAGDAGGETSGATP